MYDVNVKGTRNVLQACLEAGVERVVQTSSHVALGAHGPMPADEGAVFNLGDTGDHYCSSKHQAQQVAQEYAGRGLSVVVVNPTMIAGAGDRGPTPTGQIVLNVMKGAMPAYLDGTTNLVHVEDVAAAQVSAMERGRPGECYLLGRRESDHEGAGGAGGGHGRRKGSLHADAGWGGGGLGERLRDAFAADRQAAVDHGRLVETGGAALCLGLRQGSA